jgi:hypothetical protein
MAMVVNAQHAQKRTAQASKSHQIKRTVQISSGTIAIVM